MTEDKNKLLDVKLIDAGGYIGSFHEGTVQFKTVFINDRGYQQALIIPEPHKPLLMLIQFQTALKQAQNAFSDPSLLNIQTKQLEAKIEALKKPLTLIPLETGTEEKTEFYFNDMTVCLWAFFWKKNKLQSISFQKYPSMNVHSWKNLKQHESVKLADIYTAIFEGIL